MRVSSPVGEFPFEPVTVLVRGDRLRIEGRVGGWPAHVEMEVGDLIRLARLAGPRAALPVISMLSGRSRRQRTEGGRD
jgi:hypothetical protein